MEEAGTVWAGDVCAGDAETGERVVVAGGGGIGCETALHLARQGKKVTVVEMLAEAACDFNFINRGMLLELMAEAGVEVRTGLKVVEIRADGVTTVDGAGGRGDITADTVVLALGMAPAKRPGGGTEAGGPARVRGGRLRQTAAHHRRRARRLLLGGGTLGLAVSCAGDIQRLSPPRRGADLRTIASTGSCLCLDPRISSRSHLTG